MELRLLPDFTMGGTPDWGSISDFIIANTSSDEWADGFMTKEELDKYIIQFFGNISYSPKPNVGLTYQDGKYIASGGFSFYGSHLYGINGSGKRQDQR